MQPPKHCSPRSSWASNNRIDGTIEAVNDGYATIKVGPTSLTGRERCGPKSPGEKASAIIRLEAVRLASEPGANRIALDLATSMYLGSHWEHLFRGDGIALLAHSPAALQQGRYWIEFPKDDLWIY